MKGVNPEKLERLSDPFPAGDIEWRISQAWPGRNGGVHAKVFAYITARAIANRLDQVCGHANWQNTPLESKEFKDFIYFQVGISIRIDGEWITRYDVSEPTGIESAKGGFSGAMKRAGTQWGIGRYLYNLDETFVDTADQSGKEGIWRHANPFHKKSNTYLDFFWREPMLPSWALPRDEQPVTAEELRHLRHKWRTKFAPNERNAATLADSFAKFVESTSGVGRIPVDDPMCWSQHTLGLVTDRINNTDDINGPSADVHF